ncbi:hypothetical protein COO60DRAFT_1625932 [Scenedesmus sp. NREL 46B-D3]|nr:hypothetical protein COO60DRAFT_1625932 [Scenedesmus sp. NREL 46B-D3]
MAALNSTSADLGNVHRPDTDDSTEQFLMYGYKVVPCSKRYRHDWSVCPFSHTGEMAARRDPSRYLPIFCYHSKQRLPCPRGEECPYSHNLFEYWLHPQRYRTEMCQFGASCTRPVCFFAHGDHQLRHTGMPGGPQPVVAPPEPNPALAAAGFPGTLQHPGTSAAAYSGLMDGGGSMDMSALHRELSHVSAANFTVPLPSSEPLSAPLPQLPPDLLEALHNMSGGGGGGQAGGPGSGSGLSPLGGGRLIPHGSGIPASFSSGLPPPRPLARSMTVGAQPPPPLHHQGAGAGQGLDELTKQLAMMQLMQGNGATADAAAPILLSQHSHAASAGVQRVASASAAQLLAAQQQMQMGSLAVNAPVSPALSDGGRDAPSPSSRACRDAASGPNSASTARRGSSHKGSAAAPGKKAQPWSAPVSPCTSSRNGNDLTAHDARLSSISLTANGGRDGGSSGGSSPSSLGAGHPHSNGATAAQFDCIAFMAAVAALCFLSLSFIFETVPGEGRSLGCRRNGCRVACLVTCLGHAYSQTGGASQQIRRVEPSGQGITFLGSVGVSGCLCVFSGGHIESVGAAGYWWCCSCTFSCAAALSLRACLYYEDPHTIT